MLVQVHPGKDLFARATALACRTGTSVYDCVYMALAERIGARVLTADERFLRGMGGTGWKRFLVGLDKLE